MSSVYNVLLLHLCCEAFCIWSIVITCSMLPVNITFELASAHITVKFYCTLFPPCLFLSVHPDSNDIWCLFFLLWCVWDLLVPNTTVTSAFFQFSSGKTGHIWPRPEFAFRKDSNLFAQPILSSTCLHVCWWFSTNSAMHTDTSNIFCVHQNLSCHL